MTALAVFVYLLNLICDASGQLSFKAAAVESAEHGGLEHWKDMFHKRWIWMGVAFYIIEFVTCVALLSLFELSVGVMLISFNIVVIVLAGRILFNEELSLCRLAGITLISLGVILVGWGTV